MHTYTELQEIVSLELSKQAFNEPPAALFKPIDYILSIGGKRLRPVLTLMAVELFDGDINYAILPALGIEIFHNFTLLHDDVMDNAPFRRGKPTVHEIWDNNVAILSGDAMSITAYQYVVKCSDKHLPKVLKVFNQTAVNVCQGQQLDMEFEKRMDVGINEYLDMIKYKTAVLLGCSLKVGGILSNASEKHLNSLIELGENIGMAFQLQDDYLDIYGKKEIFGKNIGGDIISNKKTYLLIKALEQAEKKDLEILNYYLKNKTDNQSDKIEAVTNIYNKLEIDKKTNTVIKSYIEKCLILIENINVPSIKKEPLLELINKLSNRSF